MDKKEQQKKNKNQEGKMSKFENKTDDSKFIFWSKLVRQKK